ncbi:MAG: LuxR family transcriptional regulator [Anaerolineaceae bacterium]|nr:LuxR family transcriptional regulator [Anaerolineaceae bacterium]
MENLLNAKFFIPPLRTEHVPRVRLTEQLDAFPNRKLTLISAPAGFGKTTLVSEWIALLRQQDNGETQTASDVVWLSLDESDNDLSRFLNYLIAALRRAYQDIGNAALDMLQTPQPIPVENILISLINEITEIPSTVFLILDDYHTIHTTAIDEALTYLIEYLPSQIHLVIATREDPQLPLARLRARGELTELRATDLRFTLTETAEFLNQAMGLNLAAEDIAALEARTEGWVVGLQLAALSIQRHKDAPSLIQSFSGNQRFVLDYLIEEVLDGQPESVQNFLLRTAILNQISGSLCDVVTERQDSKTMLEMLENANLFIIALDQNREWYRYHHLFADLLRQRLHQTRSEEVPILHRRASEWYEQHGIIEQAIEHAVQAQDFERGATLIESIAEEIWGRDEHTKLRRLLDRLPEKLIHTKPQFCIYYAWSLIAAGQLDSAERSLEAAEEVLSIDTLSTTSSKAIRGRIAVTRSYLAFFQEDVPAIARYARAAIEYLPNQVSVWRSIAIVALGDALSMKGDYASAYHAHIDAVEACKTTNKTYIVMLANLKLAINARHLGRLQQTIEVCQEQLSLAQESRMMYTTTAGCFLAVWGEVLAELDELDEALIKAKRGVALTERGGDVLTRGWGYMCLARVLFSRGDYTDVETFIHKLESLDSRFDVPTWLMRQVTTWQVRVWLAQGNLPRTSQWLEQQGLDEHGQPNLKHELEYMVYARFLLAKGHLDEAISLLQRILTAAEAGGRTARIVEIQILRSLTYQERGDMDHAVAALEQSLGLAEQGGFIRIFVDEGPLMANLLYKTLERGIATEYVCQLLAAFPAVEDARTVLPQMQHPDFEFIEALSDRELEVLQLIAEGLTNPDIATRLFLSPHTIKVHSRNIYEKLDVHNRTEAVARARGLGILSSD